MKLKDNDDWKETKLTRIDQHNIKIEIRKNDRKRGGISQWREFNVINEDEYPWAFYGYELKMKKNGSDAKNGQSVVIREPLDY